MKRLFFIILLFSNGYTLAQNATQADKLFSEQQYAEAQVAYHTLLKRSPKNVLYLYRYARCAQELQQDSVAIEYFLKAGDKYALRNFYLAELYTKHFCFAQARPYYVAYLATLQDSVDGLPNQRYIYVQKQIDWVEKGEKYLRRVNDVTIVDSVIISKSEFLKAYRLSQETGHLAMNQQGEIVFTNQRNDRCITSMNGKLISTQRLLDGWSHADTLAIETKGNLQYPFMLADGITLYFASDSQEGLGGYDIYFTRYNAEQNIYLNPENVGFPINSQANDYMLAIDETQHLGWFATDRFTGDSLVGVYTFIPNDETRIIRTNDSTYLRMAAQLKIYSSAQEKSNNRTAQETNTQKINSIQQPIREQEEFLFIVNDTIICNKLADFRSLDARQLWKELTLLGKQIQSIQIKLSKARNAYSLVSEEQKKTLATTILEYESALPHIQNEYKRLTQQIRLYELRERGLI